MLKLNIRHQLPQIGLRIQHSRVDQAHDNQATMRGHTEQAESRKWITQPRIDIHSYRSRHAYGNSTMDDFTKENGQKGISDVQAAISAHAQEAWSMIDNASKTGNYVVNRAEQQRQADIMQQRELVVVGIPDPTTTLEERSELIGDIRVADAQIEFDVPREPTIEITTGSVETYLQNQGFLRQWTTGDRFDIYA